MSMTRLDVSDRMARLRDGSERLYNRNFRAGPTWLATYCSDVDAVTDYVDSLLAEVQRLQDELAQAKQQLENREGWALVRSLRRVEAERDRALAVVEAVKTYRQAAAAAGNPMWPWPALEIALAAFDAAQQEHTP
jgi:hypothetical protein